MIFPTKTFHIFKHAKSINTRITVPIGGGGAAPARFYSSWHHSWKPSWIMSTSFFEELSGIRHIPVASSASASATSGDPQVRPPCLMLPSVRDKSTGDMVYRFFNPIDKNIIKINKKKTTDSSPLPSSARYHNWSSHGWLPFADPTDCGMYLSDPFSADAVIRLPSFETFPRVLGTIRNKSNNAIKEILLNGCLLPYQYTPRELSDYAIQKFALSSTFDNNNNDCLMVLIEGWTYSLAFCKPGDTAWTSLAGPLTFYEEIIPSSVKDKVFYAMSRRGEVEAWDLRDLSSIKRTPIDYKRCLCTPKFSQFEEDVRARCGMNQRRYLVESSGDLLLVYRHVADYGVAEDGTILESGNNPHKTLRFDVYKMDFSLGKWTYVNSLGDCALFVGLSNSFSLNVCDCPGLRPNSIYFSDDSWRTGYKTYSYGGHDIGVYNLEDNNVEPFYPFGRLRKITPTPFWVAPNPHSGNVAESFA